GRRFRHHLDIRGIGRPHQPAASVSANPIEPERIDVGAGNAGGTPDASAPDEAPLLASARAIAGAIGLWFGVLLCGALFLGWCGMAFLVSRFLSPERRRRFGRQGMQRMFELYLSTLRLLGLVEV